MDFILDLYWNLPIETENVLQIIKKLKKYQAWSESKLKFNKSRPDEEYYYGRKPNLK